MEDVKTKSAYSLQARVVLPKPEGYIGEKKDEPNVDVWYLDGVAYEIQYGVPVVVPLALARHMVDAGAIESFQQVAS
ncbi:MAG: hypothetical protein LKG11_00720 [Bacilli bacterium]|jgi:hypothetical protein|nr:hypothetical protein [Bacilli bacterium]